MNKIAIKNVFIGAMLLTLLLSCTSPTYEIYDPPWNSLIERQRRNPIDDYYSDNERRYCPTSRSYVDWKTQRRLERAKPRTESNTPQQPATQRNPYPNTARQCSRDNPCKQFKPSL